MDLANQNRIYQGEVSVYRKNKVKESLKFVLTQKQLEPRGEESEKKRCFKRTQSVIWLYVLALFYEIIDGIYELLAGWHSLGLQQKWLQHGFRYCPKRIHIKGRMSVILLFCENFLEHKGQASIGEVVTMC